MKVPRSSNAMSYHFDCRKRDAGGSVNGTSRYTSTNGESRGVVHPHETAIYASNSFSDRFWNRSISDRHGGSRPRNVTRNRPNAELQAVVSSTQTGIPPTAQPPVPLSVTENLVRTHASGPEVKSYERFLFQDSQALQHESPIRKPDDGPFIVTGIPRKRQHLRTKREETAISTETYREHSVGSVLDGGSLEVDDDLRQPSLQSRQFQKENSPGDTTRLLACPYYKQAAVTDNHRCKAAAYQTIHRLKEHLYRRHQQPSHCLRCGETFPHPEDVEAHLRRPEGICDLVSGVSVEGLTDKQIQKLKSKKRKQGVTTDEDKWQDIFKIVFPDVKDRPDPYYCQIDAGSICRRILSELEERIPAMLEPVFGPLEGHKRQKVLDTFECFFAESMYQSRQGEALPKNDQDLPCEIVAPESVGNNPGAQCSLARNLRKGRDLPVLPTTSIPNTVEPSQSSAVQCRYFSPPNGTTFHHEPPEHEEATGISAGKEIRPNERASAAGPSSGPNVGFANNTHGFVSSHDPNSLLTADGTSFDLDFNDFLKGWEGHSPSVPSSWATEYFHT